jgi:hypothetical protein
MAPRVCSPDNPYTKARDESEPGDGWAHFNGREMNTSDRPRWPGEKGKFRCDDCGREWIQECSQ